MKPLSPDEFGKRFLRSLEIAGGTHSTEDILKAVDDGMMQVWGRGKTVVVTELVSFPQFNVIQIVTAFGTLDDVMALSPAIEQFGRENGASEMRMIGRKGWLKVLPKHGWKQDKRVLFSKNLEV